MAEQVLVLLVLELLAWVHQLLALRALVLQAPWASAQEQAWGSLRREWLSSDKQ